MLLKNYGSFYAMEKISIWLSKKLAYWNLKAIIQSTNELYLI